VSLKKISLKGKLALLSVLFVLGMGAFGVLAFATITEIKIGGSLYSQIRTGVDIGADFTLPSGNLIASRLAVLELVQETKNPDLVQEDTERFHVARQAFLDTYDKYLTRLPDGNLKDLLQKALVPGREYFEVVNNKYLPLILKGKSDEAEAVREHDIKPLYRDFVRANTDFTDASQAQLAAVEQLAQQTVTSRTFTLLIVALLAVAIVIILSLIIAKGILNPINATVDVLHDISKGDLTHHIEVVGTDEIARMGIALNETVDNLSGSIRQLAGDVQTVLAGAASAAGVSENLGAAAQSASTQVSVVSSAVEQVSQNIQTVSTATEEMSSSIKEISKNASEAAEVASSAARLAGSTTATMTKLSESSAEIGNVIKVITSIAEQTNLLALNATIEAARAGEAGKGFAVVANEVKELAKETAKATDDIGQKVQAIQQDAKGAVQAIEEITTVIGRINDIQNTIASAVEEQTGTTNEIARNISETAKGSSEIVSNLTGVAAATKEAQNSANIANGASQELKQVADSLNTVVSRFTLATSNGRHLGSAA
jgi:methyl-accepting chemotaxis protein